MSHEVDLFRQVGKCTVSYFCKIILRMKGIIIFCSFMLGEYLLWMFHLRFLKLVEASPHPASFFYFLRSE